MTSYLSRWLRNASSVSKIMSLLDLFTYLHLLMNISAMRMSSLIIFCSCAVWVLSRNPSSAMVSDISKRVPVVCAPFAADMACSLCMFCCTSLLHVLLHVFFLIHGCHVTL